MKSRTGSFQLEVLKYKLKDRSASFEPQLVKKRQAVLKCRVDNKIPALYLTQS